MGRLTVAAASLVLVGGCAQTPALVEPTVVTTASVAKPTPRVVAVSPNVSVSDELVAACKLHFNDASLAPKFDFDHSALGPEDGDALVQIARCVTTGPLMGRSLDLVGRTDPRGESEYNMALGDRRADSVKDSLRRLGVEGSRLAETSRGEIDATGTNESGWQRDRRVDILLR